MKSIAVRALSLVAVGIATLSLNAPAQAEVLFQDDFEGDLSLWTGKNDGLHHGEIVADPLDSGRGGVLTFSALNMAGDIYSRDEIAFAGPIQLSFDYLGLASCGSVQGDLGGFLGVAYGVGPVQDGVDIFWQAGTRDGYANLALALVDDGAWHSYSMTLDGNAFLPFHLTLEDWVESKGQAGDAFFDNVRVEVASVPEPAVGSLALLGRFSLRLLARSRRQA